MVTNSIELTSVSQMKFKSVADFRQKAVYTTSEVELYQTSEHLFVLRGNSLNKQKNTTQSGILCGDR